MGYGQYLSILYFLSSFFSLARPCFHGGGNNDLPPFNPADTIAANHAARNPQGAVHRRIALDNARVFDGKRLLPPRTVIIDGAYIGTNITGAYHIDCHNQVLLPGLIDAHAHPASVDHLRQMASYGITTAFLQSGSSPALRFSLMNHTGLTDLRYASQGAPVTNDSSVLPPSIAAAGIYYSPSQVPGYIVNQTTSDWIKILAVSPQYGTLLQPVLDAIVSAAHAIGMFTVCHAPAFEAVRQALEAGVDQVHHSPLDKPLDDTIVELYENGKQPNCPTLVAMQAIADHEPATSKYAPAAESVTKLYKAGVPILAGTDSNTKQGLPGLVPFGDSIHYELELLVDAGLTPLDALRAATSLPAMYYGLRDRGSVEVGMRADLLLVGGDPIANISKTRDIKRIFLAGIEHQVNTTTTLTEGGLNAVNPPVTLPVA